MKSLGFVQFGAWKRDWALAVGCVRNNEVPQKSNTCSKMSGQGTTLLLTEWRALEPG